MNEIKNILKTNENTLVCGFCGGKNVTTLAWVDSNTNEYKDDYYNDESYCNDCDETVNVMTVKEYLETKEIEIENLIDDLLSVINDSELSQEIKDYFTDKIPDIDDVKLEILNLGYFFTKDGE